MEESRTPFGQRLFSAREAAGLTQEQVAKKVGMAQSTLAEAEISGKRSGYVPQLAELYRVNANWLATGKGKFQPPTTSEDHSQIISISSQPNAPLVDTSEAKIVAESMASYKLTTARERYIEQINEVLKTIDDNGLATMLYESRKIAESFPIVKQTPASSA